MSSGKPTRDQADLAEVLELVLDKGIVINADIAVTVGETELLGIELRAAIASFETAAKYGLAFPSGTDMRRVERASGREPLEGDDGEPVDLGIDASSGGNAVEAGDEGSESDGETAVVTPAAPSQRPTPQVPTGSGGEDGGDGESDGTAADETEVGDAEEPTDADDSTSDQGDDHSGDDTDDQEEP